MSSILRICHSERSEESAFQKLLALTLDRKADSSASPRNDALAELDLFAKSYRNPESAYFNFQLSTFNFQL